MKFCMNLYNDQSLYKKKTMAKFTGAQQRQKILHAKDLFIKGFDYETIAEVLDVAENTLRKWGRDNDFESAKQACAITLSEIRNTLLQSFADIKDGKEPKISPDTAAKYASAFEKFSDRRKILTYMYEAFEYLTQEYISDISKSASAQEKQGALADLRVLRDKMDRVITRLTNEVLKDE